MNKLFFFIILCLIGCKKKSANDENYNQFFNSKNIKIIGISDEKGFNKSINFYDESLFYGGIYKNSKDSIDLNKVLISVNKIEEPVLSEIIAFGDNTFYRTNVVLTPGDSLSYELKNKKLRFTGKNQEHYNFYIEMDAENDDWTKLYLNKYDPDFNEYKKQCDSLYGVRLNFFERYINKHPNVSSEFKKIVKDDLRFEYLVNLVKPRSEIQGKWTVNTQEDLFSMYLRKDRNEGDFFDIKSYLNNVTIEEINQPENINNTYFKMTIIPLLRQYFTKNNGIPYTIDSFEEELKFLKENFNSSIVNYARGRLIVDYFNQGFGKDVNTYKYMSQAIESYKQSITDSSSIAVMNDIILELSSISKKIPKDINEKVLNLSRDTVNFNYTLKQKKIKVIDFWASWCQPCVEEIIVSKEKREKLAKEYNIEFLYISIDKEIQKWIDKTIDLFNYLPDNKQYKILNLRKSKLVKFLNLKNSYGISIPRYVILDENNIIIDNNAPKPSNDKFENIIYKIANREK